MKLGSEVENVIELEALAIVGGGLAGEGLRGRIPLAGDFAFFYRALIDGPDRNAGGAIENIDEGLLGRLCDCFDGAAVYGDVDQNRGAGNVHVPDSVVH